MDDAINQLDTCLSCTICKEPYSAPVVSSECHHSFCSFCIRSCLSSKACCPVCGVELIESQLVKVPVLEEIVRWYNINKEMLKEENTVNEETKTRKRQRKDGKIDKPPTLGSLVSPNSVSKYFYIPRKLTEPKKQNGKHSSWNITDAFKTKAARGKSENKIVIPLVDVDSEGFVSDLDQVVEVSDDDRPEIVKVFDKSEIVKIETVESGESWGSSFSSVDEGSNISNGTTNNTFVDKSKLINKDPLIDKSILINKDPLNNRNTNIDAAANPNNKTNNIINKVYNTSTSTTPSIPTNSPSTSPRKLSLQGFMKSNLSKSPKPINSNQSAQKKIARIDLNALTAPKLKDKLRQYGLLTNGTRLELKARYSYFTNLWNANLDSNYPLSQKQLHAKLNNWEKIQSLNQYNKSHWQDINETSQTTTGTSSYNRTGDINWMKRYKTEFAELAQQARNNSLKKGEKSFNEKRPNEEPSNEV